MSNLFFEAVAARQEAINSLLCVGLDPELDRFSAIDADVVAESLDGRIAPSIDVPEAARYPMPLVLLDDSLRSHLCFILSVSQLESGRVRECNAGPTTGSSSDNLRLERLLQSAQVLAHDVAVDQVCRVLAVIHTVQVGDDGLAVTLAFANRRGLPLSLSFHIPAIVVEDRFSRLGVGKHLDPAFYSEQARNAAQDYRLLQLRTQFAACALRCFFNSDATRSEGCAPWPIQ